MTAPGDTLRNRYQILESLGRGGMADVFLAMDARRQARVAIKVLREDLAEDPEFLRRFAQEAEALARLDHPNIVRFYSFERQGPVAFMVLDYVSGTTLRRRLLDAQGPLPLAEATAVLHQVGAALHYAHCEGIIHRDLKPGNIMLEERGKVLLADFGIAKAMESATVTTMAVGTPAYMSPEQILGRELDPRTDIYSLGVVLFEMVTGQRPFTGDESGLTGTSTLARLRDAHMQIAPPAAQQVNSSLPAGASEVIQRALAKKPGDRWPNVLGFVHAWEDALSLDHAALAAVPARRVPGPPGTRNLPGSDNRAQGEQTPSGATNRRSRVWIAVAAVVMAAILVLIAFRPFVRPAADSPDVNATAQVLAMVIAAGTAQADATVDALVDRRAQETAGMIAATVTSEANQRSIRETAAAENAARTATRAVEMTQAVHTAAAADAALTTTAEAVLNYTPIPTSTPTPTGPPTCSIDVGSAFAARWRQPSLYARLGCPTGRAHQSLAAEQAFEYGSMLWRDSKDAVYILFSSGDWEVSFDHFVEGVDPEYSCGQPSSPPSARRGFGKVWCNKPGVRDRLGNALEREAGFGMEGGGPPLVFQDFKGGMMFTSQRFGAVLVLLTDGTWQRL